VVDNRNSIKRLKAGSAGSNPADAANLIRRRTMSETIINIVCASVMGIVIVAVVLFVVDLIKVEKKVDKND